MMDNKNLFFLDAETDGLYGEFISIAVIVTDSDFREVERFYGGIKKSTLQVKNEWVRENVIPILGDYQEFDTEEELMTAMWNLWFKYRENAYAVADVMYPVEARLFERLVKMDSENRIYQGPYPFLDISSMLFIKGFDPVTDRPVLTSANPSLRHNAVYDVEQMIHIFKALKESEKER